jgi:beta-lactamase regulating signal transducer with metallopeptidase domain
VNTSAILVLLLQTAFVLSVAYAAGAATKKVPSIRAALYRLALLSVVFLCFAAPWTHERANPVVPVAFNPQPIPFARTPTAHSTVPPKARTATAETADTSSSVAFSPTEICVGTWLSGSGLLLLMLALGYGRLAAIRRSCTRIIDESLSGRVALIAREARTRAPAVVHGRAVKSPFVAGCLRPTIFLPLDWHVSAGDDLLVPVLRHEIAHIAHGDLWWSLLNRVAMIALWPQALLWPLRRAMNAASEQLCDAQVLASGVQETRYAECLLGLREHLWTAPCPSLGIGAVTSKSSLGKRVEAILDPKSSKTVRLSRATSNALKLAGLGIAASAVVLFANPAPHGSQAAQMGVTRPYFAEILLKSTDGKPLRNPQAWLILNGPRRSHLALPLPIKDGVISVPGNSDPIMAVGTLVARAEGRALEFRRLWPAPARITELLLRDPVSLKGRLLNPEGKPLSGAKVVVPFIFQRRGAAVGTEFFQGGSIYRLNLGASTQADGTFEIQGLTPDTSVAYDVDDERFAQLRMEDRVKLPKSGTATAKEVRLVPAAQMAGRVTQDGKPIAGVIVAAQSNHEVDPDSAEFWGQGETDKQGNFVIPRLCAATYNVALDLEGESVTAVAHEGVKVTVGQSLSGLEFSIIPGVTVEGVVTDGNGKPVEGVPMGVYGPAHPKSSAWVQIAITRADGRYTFHVPPGRQHVYVASQEYGMGFKDVDARSSRLTVDFQVTKQEEVPAIGASDTTEEPPQPEDKGPVPPIASFGDGKPAYGPFTLKSGAVLKLAYVQGDEDKPHELWKPDGSPASSEDVQRSLNMASFANGHRNPRSLYLRVDVEGVKRGDYSCVVQVPHNSAWSVWQSYGDNAGGAMEMATFRAPETLKVTDMRIGIAALPYQVVSSAKLGQAPLFASLSNERLPNVDNVVTIIRPREVDGKDVELAAYNRAGERLKISVSVSPQTDNQTGVTRQTFGFDGPGPIDRVELLTRDYEWVTFRGIHLYPLAVR